MEKFFYRVNQGDSLLSVANKFNIPAFSIIKLNNLKREIAVGDLLYLEKLNRQVYCVKPFEKAQDVAKRFNLDENQLLLENNLPYLFYGAKIYI